MKPNPSVNCSAHPDREAVDVCNRYPCRSYGLCEECAALHPLLHNGKELKQCKALKKELSSKTVIHAVQGKMIEKFEKKLEKTNVPEDILELYREAKKNYLIVQERIESFRTEVEKLEAALEADTYLEIEPKSFEEISKLFSEIQSKLTGVLNLKTSFHLMGTNTKAIMPFYNLSLGALVLVNLELMQKIEKQIPKTLVPSCYSFSILGGPATIKVVDKVYLLGGFSKTNISERVYYCVNIDAMDLSQRKLRIQNGT
eukprot:TRINITY_DN973_c0_g1_i1.p1 TRINITY_DN973_c0_g1~~TRINITY_DN973_c0_g1_i1.p1  ORF type:complete len:281 (-),score=31.18 TRINITY_DN973_c0_g1_i1:710-1480(-)